MRKLLFAARASEDLALQRQYLIDHDIVDAADKLELTIVRYLAKTVSTFPEIGHPTGIPDLWECFIPGTRWIAWYTFSDFELVVVDLWHTSQDRADADVFA